MDIEDVQSFPDNLVQRALGKGRDLGFKFDDVKRVGRSLRQIITYRYDDPCGMAIKALLDDINVGFDREMRYRLEKDFFHDVTGYIIRRLNENGQILRTGLRGRRIPVVFYRLPETDYTYIIGLMKTKVRLSNFLSENSSEAGYFAQYLWELAFQDLGFEILGRETRMFRGRETRLGGDLDFIAQKDGLTYGVEVKNSLSYPDDLCWKFRIAVDLGIIPLFIARWISKTQFYMVHKYGGLVKLYETSIYPRKYSEIIEQCKHALGFPLIALDSITERPKRHLRKIHTIALDETDKLRLANQRFLVDNPLF